MRSTRLLVAIVGLAAFALWAPRAGANTVQDFDNPGTTYTLQNGANLVSVGVPYNNVGQLTDGGGSENRMITFDRSDAGNIVRATIDFDFRITRGAGGGADGFSVALLSTATYGTTGAGPAFSEEPNLTNTLGFEFDTYNNNNSSNETNNHHLGVHFNNVDLLAVDPGFDFANGVFHHAHIVANLDAGTVTTFQIDSTAYVTNYAVPGLRPYDLRVEFAGRTGGAAETAIIDNVNASLETPEPCTLLLLGMGLASACARRRRGRAA